MIRRTEDINENFSLQDVRNLLKNLVLKDLNLYTEFLEGVVTISRV